MVNETINNSGIFIGSVKTLFTNCNCAWENQLVN